MELYQGVPIKEAFLKTLKELKEKVPDFEVVFESTRGSGDKRTATDVLFEYLYEEEKSLQDIFGLTEIEGELFMNKGAFVEQVMVKRFFHRIRHCKEILLYFHIASNVKRLFHGSSQSKEIVS